MGTQIGRSVARLAAGAAVLAAVAAPLAAGRAEAPAQNLRDRHVLVTVVDHDRPVTDLTAADFTVREDNVSREVLRVSRATDPMAIVVIVDTSEAARNLIVDLRAGAGAFIHAMLAANPANQIALMESGDRPSQLVPFTITSSALDHAVGRLVARPGAGAYLLDAINDASKLFDKQGITRRVVVAFTTEDAREFSSASDIRTADALQRAGAALWAIDLHGRAPDETVEEERDRARVLGDVTTRSGGQNVPVLTHTGLESAFAAVAGDLTAQYDVVYSRPDSLIPPAKVDVSVSRPHVDVIAPHWTGK